MRDQRGGGELGANRAEVESVNGSCAISDRAWPTPFLDSTHGCRSRLSAGRRPGLIAAAAAAAAGQSNGDPHRLGLGLSLLSL